MALGSQLSWVRSLRHLSRISEHFRGLPVCCLSFHGRNGVGVVSVGEHTESIVILGAATKEKELSETRTNGESRKEQNGTAI